MMMIRDQWAVALQSLGYIAYYFDSGKESLLLAIKIEVTLKENTAKELT